MFRSLINVLLNIYTIVFLLFILFAGYCFLDNAITSTVGWHAACTAMVVIILLYIAVRWQNRSFPIIVYLGGLYYFRTDITETIGWTPIIVINAIAFLLCWKFGPRYMEYRKQYLAKHSQPPL